MSIENIRKLFWGLLEQLYIIRICVNCYYYLQRSTAKKEGAAKDRRKKFDMSALHAAVWQIGETPHEALREFRDF